MPEPLYLKVISEYIPKVVFNADEGIFEMRGDVVAASHRRYDATLDWLKTYAEAPNKATTFCFYLGYMSEGGEKLIKDVIGILRTLPDIIIEWQYQRYDRDLKEYGEDLAEDLNFPFKYAPL